MDGVIVFKSDCKIGSENYRKITVLPALCKLLEIVLEKRLQFKNNVCSDNDLFQAGFKANSGAAYNILILYSLVHMYTTLETKLQVCY